MFAYPYFKSVKICLNSLSLWDNSWTPPRIISCGDSAPVDSTVRTCSSSLSVAISVEIFDEFHFACSIPLPNLAYASIFNRWPGATTTIGTLSDVGLTVSSSEVN